MLVNQAALGKIKSKGAGGFGRIPWYYTQLIGISFLHHVRLLNGAVVYIHIYVCVSVCVCVHTGVYICICIHIHTILPS